MEDFYSYGSEKMTASANYRPRNSNTCLRRKVGKKPSEQAKPPKSSSKKPLAAAQATESRDEQMMDPAEDSFHVSPMDSHKYGDEKG